MFRIKIAKVSSANGNYSAYRLVRTSGILATSSLVLAENNISTQCSSRRSTLKIELNADCRFSNLNMYFRWSGWEEDHRKRQKHHPRRHDHPVSSFLRSAILATTTTQCCELVILVVHYQQFNQQSSDTAISSSPPPSCLPSSRYQPPVRTAMR